MRTAFISLTILVVAGTGLALEGTNGSTVALEFSAGEVQANVAYDRATPAVLWQDVGSFHIGKPNGRGDEIALGAGGDMYFRVGGDTASGDDCRGLVHYDGSTYQHLVQSTWSGQSGERIQDVVVSPVTHGLLVDGHPVFTRISTTAIAADGSTGGVEIVTLDPSNPSASETTLFVFPLVNNLLAKRPTIAPDGSIYVLHPGEADTIRKLTFTSGQYAETAVGTGTLRAGNGISAGPDGFLYTFSADHTWAGAGTTNDEKDILRVDPTNGAWSVYAAVQGSTEIFDWTWSSDGKLWMGLRSTRRKGTRYVAEVVAGATTSSSTAVSTSSYNPSTVAAGPAGTLVVLEHVDYGAADTVSTLTPGSGDDGGGGGNGGGKGNGKPK